MTSIDGLPGYVALEALPVASDVKPGASIQIDNSYFSIRLGALDRINAEGRVDDRVEMVRDSYAALNRADISVGGFDENEIHDASLDLMESYRNVPEIERITRSFPGNSFVVPEWIRGDGYLDYGARIYFVGNDSIDEEDVLEVNIEAVVEKDRERFERYQGEIHGYPDCCIDYFHERDDTSPERRSVEQIDLGAEQQTDPDEPTISIPDSYFEMDSSYRFFSKEFFPEPGCSEATQKGRKIYDYLDRKLPTGLVRDYFKTNYLYGRKVAELVETKGERRPGPSKMNDTFTELYLPLKLVSRLPRYR